MGEELIKSEDPLTQTLEQVQKLAGDYHNEPMLTLKERVCLGSQTILDTKE